MYLILKIRKCKSSFILSDFAEKTPVQGDTTPKDGTYKKPVTF